MRAEEALAKDNTAVSRWYVEFRELGLNESIIRRAIALELRELEIPGDPHRSSETGADVSLYIRLARKDDLLSVSLWDRGEFVGSRRVSDTSHARILARRVGLAVGQLGRRLSSRRTRALDQLEREEFIEAQRSLAATKLADERRLGLRAQISSVYLPEGGWLVGPSLGVSFNDYLPLRFTTEVGWQAGSLSVLRPGTLGDTLPNWSQFDFDIGADYVIDVGHLGQVSVGATGAVSAVHVGGAAEADGISGQRDTWTARAGVHAGVSRPLSPGVTARIDLVGGSLLRRIPLRYGAENTKLGGAFLGLSLGITIKGIPTSRGLLSE